MNRDSDEIPSGARGPSRPGPGGAQGASRGGFRPTDDDPAADTSQQGWSGRSSQGDAPFGGYPFGNENQGRQRSGPWSFFTRGPRFLGLPVNLIYGIGALLISMVFVGAVCGRPTATGSVAGQVKGLNADRTLVTLANATVTLRGNGQTLTTTTTDVPADATGEAAYNYRFETVPRGTYSLSVTPPSGSTFQPEENITFDVQGGQLFPQSVMLLAQGLQKPRPLDANELSPGQTGYVNERGERVIYQQGSGFDASDALLMYLLWRNPSYYGYYSPPIVYSPGGSSSSYRVADPPSTSRSGQTVTQQKPSTPGQGSTRPSGSTGVTGAGPNTSSGSSSSTRPSDAVAPSQSQPSTAPGSSGANTSTQPRTSTGTGSSSGSQTTTRPNVPSQGSTRPSSSSSSPSRSSGSSSGGRR